MLASGFPPRRGARHYLATWRGPFFFAFGRPRRQGNELLHLGAAPKYEHAALLCPPRGLPRRHGRGAPRAGDAGSSTTVAPLCYLRPPTCGSTPLFDAYVLARAALLATGADWPCAWCRLVPARCLRARLCLLQAPFSAAEFRDCWELHLPGGGYTLWPRAWRRKQPSRVFMVCSACCACTLFKYRQQKYRIGQGAKKYEIHDRILNYYNDSGDFVEGAPTPSPVGAQLPKTCYWRCDTVKTR